MSNPNPVVVAGAPAIIAVLQAVQTFLTNLGTDPLQVSVKFPGAVQVFLGTVELQLPVLAGAEFGALETDISSKINAWIAKLQSAQAK